LQHNGRCHQIFKFSVKPASGMVKYPSAINIFRNTVLKLPKTIAKGHLLDIRLCKYNCTLIGYSCKYSEDAFLQLRKNRF
jgi:hypothetical protein